MEAAMLRDILSYVLSFVGIIGAIIALIYGFRSGALKSLKIGSVELTAPEQELATTRSIITSLATPPTQEKPFEIEHLARYYAQVLFQSKIAFWFSIIMASVGFFVIVAAAFMYSDAKAGTTLVQGIAGIIVDAVAALFFVQSRRAQASMSEFFEKLRSDRQQIESRRLCDEIHNPDARDALRIQLSLYYAGLTDHDSVAGKILSSCFARFHDDKQKES